MRITTETEPKPRSRGERRLRRTALVAIALLAFIGYSVLLFAGGAAFLDYLRPSLLDLTGTTSSAEAARAVLRGPARYLAATFAAEPVEDLYIDVKFKHLLKVREKREEALRLGILMASSADLVPATIRHGDRTIPVKLRLKGDYVDHFEGEKWSFRIQTRRGDQIFGMRRFSLQAPRTRGFQGEPIVLAHLRREGVLAPRYFFVNVTVNGKDVGLMAVEEHFSKELLESQQRREGVIIRFDENPFFEQRILTGNHGPYDNPLIASIQPFRSAKVAESEALTAQLATATGMLRAFLSGALPAAEVFDVDLVARFLAVAEVWRSTHLLRWHNLRFYFNPLTQRLEPVGFDVNLQYSYLGPGLVTLTEHISERMLADEEVRTAFVRHLHRLAGEFLDGSLPAWIDELERPLLRVLHREFPFRAPVQLAPLIARARALQEVSLDNFAHQAAWGAGSHAAYAAPLSAYILRDGRGSRLELVNALPVPVEVEEIRFTGLPDAQGATGAVAGDPLRLAPTPLGGAPTPVTVEFEAPAESFGVELVARVVGQGRTYAIVASPYAPLVRANPIPTATRQQVLARHAFLRWDEAARSFRATTGTHRVAGSLVLSEGDGLHLEPGTVLQFAEGAALIASGPLEFRGSAEAPVVLEPRPGADSWAGVYVLRSDRPYAWRHVTVRGTAGIDAGSWAPTGGVTLRASEVTLADSTFAGNRAEDALNLVRSRFELRGVSIHDTPSDALDADFSDGEIHGGHWARIGGDGIDVSGAEIAVEGAHLEQVRDKALSVGEGSRLVARGLRIERAGTALASKDRSTALLEDSQISDVAHVGLMAYVKKPEYGPASIEARGVVFERVPREVLAQLGSRIALDGREIEPEAVDVDELYRTGFMKK